MSQREKLQPVADDLFTRHSEIDKVFLASNGQGFTEEGQAKAYAEKLSDKNVYFFERGAKPEAKKLAEGETDTDEERATLLAKYESLYGKKAMSNIGTAKLLERIAEKEAELLKEKEAENAGKIQTPEPGAAENADKVVTPEQTGTGGEATGTEADNIQK